MNEDLILNEIIKLFDEKWNFNKIKITENTSLNFDLNINGDDASEVLGFFIETYNLDDSEFVFSKYFKNEYFIFELFKRKEKIPLTIKMICKFIQHKKFVTIQSPANPN